MAGDRTVGFMLDCRWDGTAARLSDEQREAVARLAKDLTPLGVAVEALEIPPEAGKLNSSAHVTFTYSPDALKRLRTRNAGRTRVDELPEASPLRGMTCAEAAAWLDERREKDRLEALGVAHAEYYRRRKDLAAYLEADEARGAEDFAEAYRDRIERIRPRKS